MRSEPPTGDELTRLLVSMKHNVLEQVANEPAPAKRTGSTHRLIGLGVGVTLLLGIGAGAAFALGIVPTPGEPAASPPSPTSSPSSTPKPTPSAPAVEYAVQPGQPASRFGFDCETLVDDSVIAALFTTAVEPIDPIVSASTVHIDIPRVTSTLQAGGTVCEWSNDVPMDDKVGQENAGVIVSVLPRPAAGWNESTVTKGYPDDWGSCYENLCYRSAEVGDAWVSIDALGGTSFALDHSGWQPFVDTVFETVRAAGPAEPPMFTEQTSSSNLDECEALIPVERVMSITSSTDAQVYPMFGGGAWSEWVEARLMLGNQGCAWSVPDRYPDGYFGRVDWIDGARWAYERMLIAGTSSPIDISGLGSGDSAVIRCEEVSDDCAVDLAIGPDWYNVKGNDRESTIALAEELLRSRTD